MHCAQLNVSTVAIKSHLRRRSPLSESYLEGTSNNTNIINMSSSLTEQEFECKNLIDSLNANGQEHIANMISSPSHPFVEQLRKVSISASMGHFSAATADKSSACASSQYEPIKNSINTLTMQAAERVDLSTIGKEAISRGAVAAVIMSGGQGTRLGFEGPKGMYDLGLPSGKTIFQLHIEKIQKMHSLSGAASVSGKRVPIYIMTSDMNHDIIVSFFKEQKFFGWNTEDFFFFQQDLEPCFTFDGRMIIESTEQLSMAPDGNGGIYKAMINSGALDDMQKRGVEHLHVYGIDNVLTQSIDPLFLGLCIKNGAEVGNKVVWRQNKAEKVGVTAESNGRMYILEYSEIPADLADAADTNTGKLLFGAANICNHYLSVPFLTEVVAPQLSGMYHVAKKKIPFLDTSTMQTVQPTENNGVKLEMFIFDVFPLASKWIVVESDRADEFAPVKNAPGCTSDSPDTARGMINEQSIKWLQKAGAVIEGINSSRDHTNIIEVSPLVSYAGEGLEHLNGKIYRTPYYIS